MPKSLLVAKREYLKVIRKPSFWASTLIMPALMIVLIFISGYSSTSVEDKLKQELSQLKSVLVLDESGNLDPALISAPFQLVANRDSGVEAVKSGSADAFIDISADVVTSHNIQVYGQDRGLIGNSIYSDLASNLLKGNILLGINDPAKLQLYTATFNVSTNTYKEGAKIEQNINSFVVPAASVLIYILLITFAASYLLLSVSEEKENRVIETILSIIKPRQLITGKIVGQLAIVVTQLFALLSLAIVILIATHTQLPFDLSQVVLTPAQVLWGFFYLICGFIIMANIMVGVGAAMPTYKEAQSFSSIFILMSFIPIYFAAIILAEPSGTVAMIASYFPLTAPMILMFRNALGELSLAEQIVSSLVLITYVYLTLVLAFKLFEYGSMEYSRQISFISFLRHLRTKK